jgi:hypothetical protein
MKVFKLSQIMALATLVMATGVQALPLGMTDITVYDGDSKKNESWYGKGEDQEVEPGMDKGQKWDLEGFFSYGQNQIAIVGGFDFRNGVAGYRGGRGELDFRAGDIFIDINNDHIAGNANANDGNGQHLRKSTFGYEFVLDVDWLAGTYEIFQLTADSKTRTAYYDSNYGSSPWKYESGGISLGTGSFIYESGLTDAQTGFLGGNHYAVYGFDLSFLGNTDYTIHFTEGCGNDNLMGKVV